MRVLVTGASGYIGAHVVDQLLKDGHHVLAADKVHRPVSGDGGKVAYLDVPIFSGSPDIYKEVGSPDACIHLAWQNGFQHNDDAHLENLAKHYVFIRDMLKGGLPQIIGMGTMHEVGYWEGAISEDTPTKPMSSYGIAKNATREFTELLARQNGAVFQWIRAYYITGDDAKSRSIFHKILEAEAEGKKTFPFNSGKSKYDFIDVDELAKQICAVASQKKIDGVINCCSGVPMALGEKVEQFIKDHNLSIRLEYGAFPDREYDSPGVWGKNEKIKRIMQGEKRSGA